MWGSTLTQSAARGPIRDHDLSDESSAVSGAEYTHGLEAIGAPHLCRQPTSTSFTVDRYRQVR